MIKLFKIFILVSLLILCQSNAYASFVLDGNLDDWGVTPFADWTPNTGTSYTVENNYNRSGSDPFQEGYDLEAMYLSVDASYINFAIVSSNHYSSGWAHESLFLDFSGQTVEELIQSNGVYAYAMDLAPVPLNQLSTKGVYAVNPDSVYTLQRTVNGIPSYMPASVAISSWATRETSSLSTHDYIGSFNVYNKSLGVSPEGGGNRTYVLEGQVSASLFTDELLGSGTVESYFSRISCLKDWITVRHENAQAIPEPSTVLLLGQGILGFVFFKRKKNKA